MFNLGTIDKFTDSISIVDPEIVVAATAVKLGMNKGAFWQAMSPFSRGAINANSFAVFGRTITGQNGTLSADIDNAVLTIPVASSNGITLDNVIKIEDELVIVSEVTSATEIKVYARGAGGTTPAPHTNGTKFEVVSTAGKDVDLRNLQSITESTKEFINYTQLYMEALDFTKQGVLGRQGLSPEQIQDLALQEALTRVLGKISYDAINGRKQAGGNGSPSMTAGLIQQLTDTDLPSNVIDGAGVALTEAMLKSTIEASANYGTPDTIVVGPSTKGIINGFTQASASVDVTQPLNATYAGNYVSTYIYEGVALNILVDADMPADSVAVLPIANAQFGWAVDDILRVVEEPALSSREFRKTVQGSCGFGIENPIECAIINNLG